MFLFDPTGSITVDTDKRLVGSPITTASDYATAKLTARAMIGALPRDDGGTYWRDRGSQLLGALLHVAARMVPDDPWAPRWIGLRPTASRSR